MAGVESVTVNDKYSNGVSGVVTSYHSYRTNNVASTSFYILVLSTSGSSLIGWWLVPGCAPGGARSSLLACFPRIIPPAY